MKHNINKKALGIFGVIIIVLGCVVGLCGCTDTEANPQSDSGATKATVEVPLIEFEGELLTQEQINIIRRVRETNQPGNIQYLYLLSEFSGDIIWMSTVDGKVTSGGKRLQPFTLTGAGEYGRSYMEIQIGNEWHRTSEVIQDDGTYGSSSAYIFWWDMNGNFHQHWFDSGGILHLSSYPIETNTVIINLDILGDGSTAWD